MDLEGPGGCQDLPALCAHIGDCVRCPLSETRTRLVFGVGDPHAQLMFIGEAPGRNEDLTGEPFVGAAGKLLDELLAEIGYTREQVYIANVVKCRPPGNRDPQPLEIATCTPFLARQIELIDPVVIATLGKFATHYILDTTIPISKLRGRLYRVAGRPVVPVFHPAAALYDGSKRQVLGDDFRRIKAVIERSLEALGAGGEQPPLFGGIAAPEGAFITAGEAETQLAGAELGRLARSNDVVTLSGDLGAGKTALVQGIGKGLGLAGRIPSPTFNIMLVHEGGRMPLYHFDLYRLERPEQLEDVDLFETIESGGLSAIEWADRFEREMPADRLDVRMETIDETHRRITPIGRGTRSAALAEQWLQVWRRAADGS